MRDRCHFDGDQWYWRPAPGDDDGGPELPPFDGWAFVRTALAIASIGALVYLAMFF